jgi:N-acetylmuramate 1-kinase
MKPFDPADADLEKFVSLFLKKRGLKAEFASTLLASDGSTRVFRRITLPESPVTFVLMENPPVDGSSARENRAYLMIGRHLFNQGLPVPEIYGAEKDRGWFMLEDLGDVNLQQAALSPEGRIGLYLRVVDVLFRLQIRGAESFDPGWTCQTRTYDAFVMRRYEADYFRDAFLGEYLGLRKDWPELESPLEHLAARASLAEPRFFLHRDFQSRNIMMAGERIGIVDWQGGRLGPPAYDLASLLIDPYTGLSQEEQRAIYEKYVSLLAARLPEEVDSFCASYPYLALQRNLQILGAFSFLSKVRKKKHFEKYIPPALASLKGLLLDLEDKKLSALTELVTTLCDGVAEARTS